MPWMMQWAETSSPLCCRAALPRCRDCSFVVPIVPQDVLWEDLIVIENDKLPKGINGAAPICEQGLTLVLHHLRHLEGNVPIFRNKHAPKQHTAQQQRSETVKVVTRGTRLCIFVAL